MFSLAWAPALCAAALLIPEPRVSARLHERRHRADLRGPAALVAVFAGVLCFLLVGRLTVAVAAVSAGACVAWVIVDTRRARQRVARDKAMAAFLGAATADLRAGALVPHALRSGCAALPEDTPAELRASLLAAAQAAEGGGSLGLVEGGVGELGALVGVSERHGIPLAGVLEQAQSRLDAAARHRAATAASLQGPQATSVVLALLPLAGIGMGTAMGANPVGFLFGGGLGGVLLVVGVGLVAAGFVWSRRMIGKAAG